MHVPPAKCNVQGNTRLLVTHQRQFLPYCDRILVLKHGTQKALGTYSQLADSALTELTQLEEEAEIDDAIYDQQLPTGAHSASALQGTEAGPFQAQLESELPTALAAAKQAVDSVATTPSCVEQLDSTTRDDTATAVAASTTANRTSCDAASPPSSHTEMQHQESLQRAGLSSRETAQDSSNLQSQQQQPARQNAKSTITTTAAVFVPAVVKKRKYVIPPAVDNRWGPEKACSRWLHKLRGGGNPQTGGDDLDSEAGDEEQAQLNQQEGRSTGMCSQATGSTLSPHHTSPCQLWAQPLKTCAIKL